MRRIKFTLDEKFAYAFGYYDGRTNMEATTANLNAIEAYEYTCGYTDGQVDAFGASDGRI